MIFFLKATENHLKGILEKSFIQHTLIYQKQEALIVPILLRVFK